MQTPANETDAVSQESCTGLKYQCDYCDVVLFINTARNERSDVAASNHYRREHPDVDRREGTLDGVTYVGHGEADWGTETDSWRSDP